MLRKLGENKIYVISLIRKLQNRLLEKSFNIASIQNMDVDTLCRRLLLGNPSLGTIENKVIIDAMILFLKNSSRLD